MSTDMSAEATAEIHAAPLRFDLDVHLELATEAEHRKWFQRLHDELPPTI
jgi:hypothetical protein